MRKLKKSFIALIVFICVLAASAGATLGAGAQEREVYLGGMPAGFTLGIGGAQIVGVCEVLTEDGPICPAKQAGLEVGDLIIRFNGLGVEGASDIDRALAASAGKESEVIVMRDGKEESATISPAKDLASNKYKIGVLIRDSVSGIGTITYIEKGTLRFGSLGHPVAGEDGALLGLGNGAMYKCNIVNVIKGERGKAGELKGLIASERRIASADKNCATGIYGTLSEKSEVAGLVSIQTSSEAQPGKASVYTTVEGGTPKEYSISIVKVDEFNKQNKNFVIKITDKELLASTGGIVQGMSGSPIVQDGKLVGAVTHVFLNDPTRGYGISIDKMMAA